MSGIRPIARILVGILVCALTIGVLLQRASSERLRAQNRALQEEIDLSKRLDSASERVSILATSNNGPGSESPSPELLRLRGEVAVLRRRVLELEAAHDSREQHTNTALRALPEPPYASPDNIFPRESWAFAGYANPQDTVKTWVWAMMLGNKESFINCFAPGDQSTIIDKLWDQAETSRLKTNVQDFRAFRILGQHTDPDGTVSIAIHYDGLGVTRGLPFVRIGNEWKLKIDTDRN